ncbi:hypothetical protein [Pseudomonas sp. NBRC 111121]|uniref:hypothetical protein n=1 Tax=Pseudomonas sp. NBRC 111121 TaxID=1661036 RepID=UPI0012E0D457|nr:hypothetical protein [Pseudomonas sp. NBRC 111121]
MKEQDDYKIRAEQLGFTMEEFKDYILGNIIEEEKINPHYLVDSREEVIAILNEGVACSYHCLKCGTGILRTQHRDTWVWQCLNRKCLSVYKDSHGKPTK